MIKFLTLFFVAMICMFAAFAADHYFAGQWHRIPSMITLSITAIVHAALAFLSGLNLMVKDKQP